MRPHSPTQPWQQKATFWPFQLVVGLSAGRAQSGCMGQSVLTAPMSAAVLGLLVAQPESAIRARAESVMSLFMSKVYASGRGDMMQPVATTAATSMRMMWTPNVQMRARLARAAASSPGVKPPSGPMSSVRG